MIKSNDELNKNDEQTHSHNSLADERNKSILISVNGEIVPREQAMVSVFDSGFILGDGVWEGMRVHNRSIPFLDDHIKRLYGGAKAIDIHIHKSKEELINDIVKLLQKNNMENHVHIRLMVTRGVKSTPYQDPRVTIGDPTIVIIPEYKMPTTEIYDRGLNLFTTHIRRTAPDMLDQKINSHSKLNCILSCIQATKAGADEALMLDQQGAVATCNSTHFFIVKDGVVMTSDGLYCLGGITRRNIINICKDNNIPIKECRFSLFDVYNADEAFVTGTFAGVIKVKSVDGRLIENQTDENISAKLSAHYIELVKYHKPLY